MLRKLSGILKLWADLSLRVKGALAVTVPVITLLVAMLLLYQAQRSEITSDSRISDGTTSLAQLSSVEAALSGAESSVLHYRRTAQPLNLASYHRIRGNIALSFSRFKILARSAQTPDDLVLKLEQLVRREVLALDRLAALPPHSRALVGEAFHELFAADDSVSAEAQVLRSRLDEEISLNIESQNESRALSFAIIRATACIGMGGGVLAVMLLMGGLVGRVERLERNAARMAKREALEPAPHCNDEIGRLDTALRTADALLAEGSRKLEESEHHYRALFENAHEAIVVFNDERRYIDVNPAAAALLGYSREEWLRLKIEDVLVRNSYVAAGEEWDSFIQTGQVKGESQLRQKDGGIIDVDFHAVANVEPGEHLAVIRDITARKKSETLLREAHAELEKRVQERTAKLSSLAASLREQVERGDEAVRKLNERQAFVDAILENLEDSVVACDAEGILTTFNRAAYRLHGKLPRALPADEWASAYELRLPNGALMLKEEIPLFRAWNGEHVRNMELLITPEDSAPHRLIVNGDPLYDPTGNKLGAVVVMHDITERRALEEAEQVSKAKSEFLSRMSHELRTPMNAILGFAQLLEMDELQPPQQSAVDQILRAGRHLLNLINEVLEISRIEAGRVEYSIEPVEAGDAVNVAVDLIGPLATSSSIRIRLPAESCQLSVLADRQRLHQVLVNLVSNAVKYNRAGGEVVLSCERRDEWLRINVRDTGRGIASEDLKRLFVPFERLGTDQAGIEGTGIGLAISHRLVEGMGGRIGVESRAGEGSTFWVEFPLTDTQPAEAIADESVGVPVNFEGSHLLLYIEDNLSNVKLVTHILEPYPEFKLIVAMQGRIGIDLAFEHRPDLIFLDIHLPDVRGDQILAELRADARTRKIPIIMLTADATAGQKERLLAAGADHYLTKPLNVREFLGVIEGVLSQDHNDPLEVYQESPR